MTPSVAPGSLFQVGTQSAFDTAVAATAKLAVPWVVFEPTDQVMRPRLAKGLMGEHTGNEFVTERGVEWSVPAHPANYDQIAGWFGTVIAGGVTPTFNTPDYTYVFTRNPAAMQALNLLTLERRLSEFSNHIDEEWLNCVGRELTLSGQGRGEVQLAVRGFGSARAGSTLTAAQTMPEPTHIPFALSKVWRDAAWANLGTTQLTGQVLSWSVAVRSGAVGLPVADGRANLDYGVRLTDGRQVGHTVTMRLLQEKAVYNAEVAAAEAQTLRAVRLQMDGAANRRLRIDALCKHAAGSLSQVDESDGQVVYDVNLVTATDGTNMLVATVVNQLDNEWGT